MNQLLENLARLNRKERFHLVWMALSDDGWTNRDSFPLSAGFRQRLGAELGLTVPRDAFAAMDYQLDWLYAALHLTLNGACGGVFTQPEAGWFNANQEDVDLLVAFVEPSHPARTHLILIEAKCETGWTNSQVQSKIAHLESINRELSLADQPQFQFHMVLVSPRYSQGLNPQWPDWVDWQSGEGRHHWLAMPLGDHWHAMRCDAEGHKTSKASHWRVRETRRKRWPE